MYRLGHTPKHHYWVLLLGVLLLAGVGTAGVFVARSTFQPHTVITQAKPYIGSVSNGAIALRYVVKPSFKIGVPGNWEAAPSPSVPYTVYSWRGTGADSPRSLDLYIDKLPVTMAINRLLPIMPEAARISIAGTVSDNCVRFTSRTAASVSTGAEAAKWSGVSFLCDESNYERDVVGTGSPDGINTTLVNGPATGSHPVFFVYTDNSASPDYTIFENIVKSFQAL